MLARDELRQVAPLLFVRAVAADLGDAEIGMGAVAEPDRGRGPADLLHGDAMLQGTEPGAAIVLLDRDAVEPEFAHLRPEVAREDIGSIDLVGPRRDHIGREVAYRAAQHVGGLAEIEVEARDVVAPHEALP